MEVKISVSRKDSFIGKDHTHFNIATGEFKNLASVMIKRTWSPILWKDGHRLKLNFQEANLIALDFDSGIWTLDHAKEFFSDYQMNFILGTTKSHQKEKITSTGTKQAACDRFRVIIGADGPCTSLEDYEYTMQKFMEKMPCDKSCKDGARYFFPCKEIVTVSEGGNNFSWETKPEEVKKAEQKRKVLMDQNAIKMAERGTIPKFIYESVRHGVKPDESRHRMSYRIGAELSKIGYGEDEICRFIMSGPIAAIGENDVRRAVRNGIEASAR